MNYLDVFALWKDDTFFDEATRTELAELTSESEIEDRFYCDLVFGTGGLRGVMGAGTNRMNCYTVGKATVGLAEYLIGLYGTEACRKRGVVIGYDTRCRSELFAHVTADVLSAKGIHACLQKFATPVPQLSFSVAYLNALAGVMITASHNPKEYNGYKVYDEFGCQLVPNQANAVIAYVNNVTDYRSICFCGNASLISYIDTTDAFVNAVLQQSRLSDSAAKKALKVVYTPLHGTGKVPVLRVLAEDGFSDVMLCMSQAEPDGNFPTVRSPNPEDRRALELAIEQAQRSGADLVLGTDPDCDRVGIAVRMRDGNYQLLTGNQVGALLADYILAHTDLTKFHAPALVKTEVTSELGVEIARRYGVAVFSTLTGFKFIGEKITQFEQAKKNGDDERSYDFLFGYEESYGYLVGTHARDKDAVVSTMLICEMCAALKASRQTLCERLSEIYTEFGCYQDALDSFTMKGKEGLEYIAKMMDKLRSDMMPLGISDIQSVVDYSMPVAAEQGFGHLPRSNVLKYILADGSWFAVRPSGTEPKIKIYYSVKGDDATQANHHLADLRKKIIAYLKLDYE